MNRPNILRSAVTGERSVGLTWGDLDNLAELVYNVMDVTTHAGDGHAADDAFKALLDCIACWQEWTYDGVPAPEPVPAGAG